MSFWADNREAKEAAAREGWNAGLSAGVIAGNLTSLFGVKVTRKAVYCRISRLGLAANPSPERLAALQARKRESPAKAVRPRPAKVPAEGPLTQVQRRRREARAAATTQSTELRRRPFVPLPGSAPRPWETRKAGECKWPVGGSGADTLSCCGTVFHNGWCADHWLLGHDPSSAPLYRVKLN